MKRTLLFYFILMMLQSTLPACSVLSPIKTEDRKNYLLTATPSPKKHKTHQHINLFVAEPSSNPVYNTTDMIFTTEPYQIGYFVKNNWAEPPAEMLKPLLIQTLTKTHFFGSVSSVTTLGRYNYILQTHLETLQQDFSHGCGVVHLILKAQLLEARSNRILATKTFSINEPLRHNDPYSGVIAANRATYRLLLQLTHFCIRALGH